MNQARRGGDIDRVLESTDIIDLIGEYTTLEKKGKGYMGLCPFHEEKTPSFSVSEEKQVYHCFSCKASGNALTFVKDIKGYSTPEAVKHLADRANITIEEKPYERKNQKYFDINYAAMQFYKVALSHTEAAKGAREYLKNRGVTPSLADTFDLGYAPDKKDALYQALSKKEYLKSDLTDLGLVREKENVFDIFRGRIMFPIQDAEGQVVGFSGRIIEGGQAKYINSPATPVFEKQKVLYNLHRARRPAKEKDRFVLFEGFMDVIAAHKAGIEEGIAIMGTALTRHHVDAIQNSAKRLVLCFDGDKPGREATRTFLEQLKKSPFEVRVAEMPDGLDPDDYIDSRGDEAFRKLIDDATSREGYLYETYRGEAGDDIASMDAFKDRVFKLIRPLSAVQRDHFLKRLSEDLDVSLDTLRQDFEDIRPAPPAYSKAPAFEITDKFRRAERSFIHYFLNDEYYERRFRSEFEDVTYIDKAARDIQFEIFEYYDFNRQSCIVPELFKASLTENQRAYFDTYIDTERYPYSNEEFEDLLKVMREYTRRNKIRALKQRIKRAETVEEKIRYKEKIDAMYKEAKHGKGKNRSGTY